MTEVDLVWSLNTVSGQVDRIPRHLLEHFVFAANLVEVEPGTKSYDPEKYQPKSAEEYKAAHAKKKAEVKDNK